jgi:hypothetical protein
VLIHKGRAENNFSARPLWINFLLPLPCPKGRCRVSDGGRGVSVRQVRPTADPAPGRGGAHDALFAVQSPHLYTTFIDAFFSLYKPDALKLYNESQMTNVSNIQK